MEIQFSVIRIKCESAFTFQFEELSSILSCIAQQDFALEHWREVDILSALNDRDSLSRGSMSRTGNKF